MIHATQLQLSPLHSQIINRSIRYSPPTQQPRLVHERRMLNASDSCAFNTTISGYDFYPLQSSSGNDIPPKLNGSRNDFAISCNALRACVAFNTVGYRKYIILPQNEWVSPFSGDPCLGFYIKQLPPGKALVVSHPMHAFSKRNDFMWLFHVALGYANVNVDAAVS